MGSAADRHEDPRVAASVRPLAELVRLARDPRARTQRHRMGAVELRQLAAGEHRHSRLRPLLARSRRSSTAAGRSPAHELKVLSGEKHYKVGTMPLIEMLGVAAKRRLGQGRGGGDQGVGVVRVRGSICVRVDEAAASVRLVCVLLVLALVLAAGSLLPASAAAETTETAQARIANAEFLVSAPPQATASAICLVDTGVDESPDTGAVQARMSLWDDTVDDMSPTKHGTHLATMIAASANGWGMVGIWPGAKLVSIRANLAGADAFPVASYYQGMRRCRSVAAHYGVTTILLALGSTEPLTDDERSLLEDEVTAATRQNLVVVAAAGNTSGGPVTAPANLDGVFSVGGVAADATRCAISAVGAILNAPGCGLDAIRGDGTPAPGVQGLSEAAAVVAASIAALRAYRPDLDPEAATQLLLDHSVAAPSGAVLDVEATFRAAGLETLVGPPATTPRPPSGARPRSRTKPLPDLTAPVTRLPRPRALVRRTRPGLVVAVRNRDRDLAVSVEVRDRSSRSRARGRVARFIRRSDRFKVIVKSRSRLSVRVRLVDTSGVRPASRAVAFKLPTARGRRR